MCLFSPWKARNGHKQSFVGWGMAGSAGEGSLEMLECWHLTADGMATLMQDCLLPLAEMHASLGLAHTLQPEGALALPPKPRQPGQQPHSHSQQD